MEQDRRRGEIGVRARHLAAPRHSDNPPLVPGRGQRQHRVDHRQPGADQQHVAAARRRIGDRRRCFVAPRIVDQARSDLRRGGQRRWRRLPMPEPAPR